MITRFTVEVYENGVVVIPSGIGTDQSRVFDKNHMEDALLEMYRQCVDWKIGEKIRIERLVV